MCSALVVAAEGPPAFLSVEDGLGLIDSEGPGAQTSATLRGDVCWFARMQRALEAMSARWLAELDRRDRASLPDFGDSCTDWLQSALQLSSAAAYARVRTARQLEQLPRTADALRSGEVGGPQASVICRALEECGKTGLDPVAVESALLEAARELEPKELHRRWQQLRYRGDQAAGLEAEAGQWRGRWFRMTPMLSDGYRLEGVLDAEGGEVLKTALEGVMGKKAKDDPRTPGERRADALVELGWRRLEAGDLPRVGGERPHLAVVAELSTLRLEPGSALAELDWGPRAPRGADQPGGDETAPPLACRSRLMKRGAA